MHGADDHTFLFIGGLNRSGTTLLTRAIAQHPRVSAFHETPAPNDEGMHLQTVYPAAKEHGGAGRFAFAHDAHLTEASPLTTAENARTMLDDWSPWWDMSRPVLVEKSPPNLIRMRFLQALFPRSRFVAIVRHPVAVTLATRRWSKTSIDSLIRHWVRAHDLFEEDRAHVVHLHVVTYENLIVDPQRCVADIHRFLELEPHPPSLDLRTDCNRAYFEQWRRLRARPVGRLRIGAVERRHETAVRRHGYSLTDLALVPAS